MTNAYVFSPGICVIYYDDDEIDISAHCVRCSDCDGGVSGLEDQAGHDVRVPIAASPDPAKPYPNPELEAEKLQQRALIEYRRSLRDFLHGTHTEGEEL